MLTKYVNNKKKSWDDFIDTCVFAYNTSQHESTKFTPFELMFGRKAYLPIDATLEKSTPEQLLGEWQQQSGFTTADIEGFTASRQKLVEDAKSNIKEAQKKQKHYYDLKHAKPCIFDIGAKVLLKDFTRKKRKGGKLDKKWIGPFEVQKSLSKGLFVISAIDNPSVSVRRVTGAHLKPYLTPPASPPKDSASLSHHNSFESSLSNSYLKRSFDNTRDSRDSSSPDSSFEVPLDTIYSTPIKRAKISFEVSPDHSSLDVSTPVKGAKRSFGFSSDLSPIKSGDSDSSDSQCGMWFNCYTMLNYY